MIGDLLQPTHLLILLGVALLILGPKRLPEAGRSLGHAIHDFRGGLSGPSPEISDGQATVSDDVKTAVKAA